MHATLIHNILCPWGVEVTLHLSAETAEVVRDVAAQNGVILTKKNAPTAFDYILENPKLFYATLLSALTKATLLDALTSLSLWQDYEEAVWGTPACNKTLYASIK